MPLFGGFAVFRLPFDRPPVLHLHFNFRMIGIKISVLLLCIAIIECTLHEVYKCPQYPTYCTCYEKKWDALIPGLYNQTSCEGKVPNSFVSKIADLRFTDTSIGSIPPGLPTSILRLIIQKSDLIMSPDDYVNIPTSVKYLILPNNEKISKFNLTYLDHVPNLTLLDLSHNPLTSLDIPSTSPIRLTSLYLDGIEWKTLDTTKYEMSKIINLGARNGKIENVRFNFHDGGKIMLENNRISTFDATKMNVNGMYSLDLSRNPIQKLDFSSGVDNLHTLKLRDINLKIFDGSKFHLPSLNKLDLSDNPIETVYINGFSIRHFIFKKIGLTCFDDRLEGMSKIVTLDLENNDLKTLHLTQDNINSIDIKGNKQISRIKLHSLPMWFYADEESLPCDCCLLKLLSNKSNPRYAVCRNARLHSYNLTLLANAIGCDLNRSKTEICDSLPPMPACD